MPNVFKAKYEIIESYGKYLDKQNRFTGDCIHYTSFQSAFAIMDSDSFWASNVRFSNDSMEEKILQSDDSIEERDDYILCYCMEDDMLSQWRGYCHNGGVAIKFHIQYMEEYSILHADYDETGNYVLYRNAPLPVMYMNNHRCSPKSIKENLMREIEVSQNKEITIEDMLPYLKNGYFYEEKEARMIFSNKNGDLSKCIRFRTLEDGIKVPYIVVKFGDAGKMNGRCETRISDYTWEEVRRRMEPGGAIWIGEGYDQERVYNEMVQHVEELCKANNCNKKVTILCKGRWPIESITVAPSYDRERKAEQIRRYCKSKYWLKRVEVKKSNIPYIQPMI